MPIFEFKCDECAHEFEQIVFASETDQVKCPACDSSRITKALSVFCSSAGNSSFSGMGGSAPSGCGGGSGGFS